MGPGVPMAGRGKTLYNEVVGGGGGRYEKRVYRGVMVKWKEGRGLREEEGGGSGQGWRRNADELEEDEGRGGEGRYV